MSQVENRGHLYVGGTDATTPPGNVGFFKQLKVVTAATIADIQYDDDFVATDDDLDAVVLPVNFVLDAEITSITLTSGSVILEF